MIFRTLSFLSSHWSFVAVVIFFFIGGTLVRNYRLPLPPIDIDPGVARARILQAIQDSPKRLRMGELARRTGLSLRQATDICSELRTSGWIKDK